MRLDNQDVAILTKVNELAEGYGIKPYEFIADVGCDPETGKTELNYQPEGKHVAKKINAMLDAISSPEGNLVGEPEDIIRALDQAIAKAPRSRINGRGRF